MKRTTLEFKSLAIEKKFSRHIQQDYVPKVTKLFNSFVVSIQLPIIIMGLINKKYIDSVIYSIGMFSLLSIKYLINKYGQYYNLFLSVFLIVVQLLLSYYIYDLGPDLGNQDKYALFYYGASLMQIQITLQNLCFGYWLSVLTIATQTAIFLALTWDTSIYEFKYQYIILNCFNVIFTYEQLRDRKMVFLLRENEKQWVKIIKNGLSSQIVTVKYHKKENEVSLGIANKNAQQMFKINNEEDFKAFSRKLKVFKQVQDIYASYSTRQYIQENSELNPTTSGGITLENQIIQFMKQTIKENDQKIYELQQNESKTDINKCAALKTKLLSKTQNRVAQFFTEIESEHSPNKMIRYRVKLSYYQSQSHHQCCIVFDQESDQQKVQNLERAKKQLQSSFIKICIKIGKNLQMIQSNLNNVERSKQYLYLSLNKLQNVCDLHFYFSQNLRRQKLKSLPFSSPIASLSLNELTEKIKDIFWEQKSKIIFNYVNCDKNLQICTVVKKLQQIFVNFIDNSFKTEIEDTVKQANNLLSSKIMLQDLSFSINPLKNQPMENSIIDNYNEQNNNQFEYYQNHRSSTTTSNNNFINRKSFKFAKGSNLMIKFRMLKGENEHSNIIKVTMKDNSGGLSTDSLIEILQSINYQYCEDTHKQPYFSNLSWKVNSQVIGQLGPYSDFFISPKCKLGIKLCFYVYSNIKIIDEYNQSSMVFLNKDFFEDYKLLQSKYYHKSSKISSVSKMEMSKSNINLPLKERQSYTEDSIICALKESVKIPQFLNQSITDYTNMSEINFQTTNFQNKMKTFKNMQDTPPSKPLAQTVKLSKEISSIALLQLNK